MTTLFLNILNMSITAGWIVLAVILLRFALKKAPKWIMCCLWAIVALRLVVPLSFESAVSLIPSRETVPTDITPGEKFEVSSGIPVIDRQINEYIADLYPAGSLKPPVIPSPASPGTSSPTPEPTNEPVIIPPVTSATDPVIAPAVDPATAPETDEAPDIFGILVTVWLAE